MFHLGWQINAIPFNPFVMINTCKDTRKINAFQYVAIPSPRDIFMKYGERVNTNPCYSCDSSGNADPIFMHGSVIEQMHHAENSLRSVTP